MSTFRTTHKPNLNLLTTVTGERRHIGHWAFLVKMPFSAHAGGRYGGRTGLSLLWQVDDHRIIAHCKYEYGGPRRSGENGDAKWRVAVAAELKAPISLGAPIGDFPLFAQAS
jgi:hypothetical protein